MSDTENIDLVIAEYGPPAVHLKPTARTLERTPISHDIAEEYMIFFSEKAAGGCIAYGRYKRGWVVNPSLRWPVAELMRLLKVEAGGSTSLESETSKLRVE